MRDLDLCEESIVTLFLILDGWLKESCLAYPKDKPISKWLEKFVDCCSLTLADTYDDEGFSFVPTLEGYQNCGNLLAEHESIELDIVATAFWDWLKEYYPDSVLHDYYDVNLSECFRNFFHDIRYWEFVEPYLDTSGGYYNEK